MNDWDFQKLAGQMASRVWGSIRQWDYFTKDSLGQQVAEVADSLLTNPEIQPENKQPPSPPVSAPITISIANEEIEIEIPPPEVKIYPTSHQWDDESELESNTPTIQDNSQKGNGNQVYFPQEDLEDQDLWELTPKPQPSIINSPLSTINTTFATVNYPTLNSPFMINPPPNPQPQERAPLRNPEGYQYFISESQDLLTEIEHQLFNLNPEKSTAEIYSLMRATHTLKGAAANVGQDTIKIIAHNLEDVFRSMLAPEAVIDPELEAMLFEGYECLRLALSAELAGEYNQNDDLLNRAADLFARFQGKLGDCFDRDIPLPSSAELGFDLTKSIFEVGVKQRLDEWEELLAQKANPEVILAQIKEQVEVFIGLAESLNLPGFKKLAETTGQALELRREQVLEIAAIALADFRQAHRQVIEEGDRVVGGAPSLALQQLATKEEELETLESVFNLDLETALATEEKLLKELETTLNLEPGFGSENGFLEPEELAFDVEQTLDSSTAFLESKAPDLAQPPITSPQQPDEENKSPFEELEYLDFQADFSQAEAIFPEETGTITLDLANLWEEEDTTELESAFGQFNSNDPPEDFGFNVISSLEETWGELDKEVSPQVTPTTKSKLEIEAVMTATPELPLILDNIPAQIEPEIIPIPENYVTDLTPQEESPINDVTLESFFPDFESQELFLNDSNLPSLEDTFGKLNLEQSEDELFLLDATQPELENSVALVSQTPGLIREIVPENKGELQQLNESILPQDWFLTDPPPNELKQPQAVSAPPLKSPTKQVRLELDHLEHLTHLVGEILINQNQLSLRDEQFQVSIEKLSDWLKRHRRTLTQLREYLAKNRPNNQQLSPIQRLLYSAIEETSQLTQATEDINHLAQTTAATIEREQRLSKHLRDNMQAARMVPIDTLFKRFPPMVKQLSFVHKKAVELSVRGSQVMIDKTITENLYDALLHLIRNAFDHGIETPEIRRQLGKPETGKIELAAYHQGNRTIIEVRDDGQGLNPEKIYQRALHNKLITPAEAETIRHSPNPEARLLDLLCQPGFSTTDRVSDLSGRGVGLDVVKTQLGNIKGSLQVRSFPQQGTVFYLQIREALMSTRLLICQAGTGTYAFVSNEIEQVLISNEKLHTLAGQKMLEWQQEGTDLTIPIYELANLLHYENNQSVNFMASKNGMLRIADLRTNQKSLSPLLKTPKENKPILLLPTSVGLIGLEVDQIIEEQELVIKPLSDVIPLPPYLYGCTILADGRLILILDGSTLMQFSQKRGVQGPTSLSSVPSVPALTPAISPLSNQNLGLYIPNSDSSGEMITPTVSNPASNTTVLIIDDSLTERQTLTMILQRAGYRIVIAKDGLEAVDRLREEKGIQAIFCDLEMPRMNGLEFLNYVQQAEDLPKLPTAILTSRSRDKFQQIALELGAYTYLTKPYTEQEILSTLRDALSRVKI